MKALIKKTTGHPLGNFSPWVLWVICITALILRLNNIQLNLSPSMPVGIYRQIKTDQIQPGHVVSVCLPDNITKEGLRQGYLTQGKCATGSIPLVKQVIAVPGDDVELSGQGITVNERFYLAPLRPIDSNGSAIRQFIDIGKYSNVQGYWLYGAHAPLDSWDSRYFGAVDRQYIISTVKPVLVF